MVRSIRYPDTLRFQPRLNSLCFTAPPCSLFYTQSKHLCLLFSPDIRKIQKNSRRVELLVAIQEGGFQNLYQQTQSVTFTQLLWLN